MTSSDMRAIDTFKKILAEQNSPPNSLLTALTLADLKAAKECRLYIYNQIIHLLGLQASVKIVENSFDFMERIQQTSSDVLERIQLTFLKNIDTEFYCQHSAVWYALAPEKDFLKRQVVELSKSENPQIAAVRLADLIKCKSPLLTPFKQETYSSPRLFGRLQLSIGKLAYLTGTDIARIAQELPSHAGCLFTEKQIPSLDLTLFSCEQLDNIIAGQGDEEDIRRRLNLLTNDQLLVFLQKSSGKHFKYLPDSVFEVLLLSQLPKERVKALFDDEGGERKKEAMRRLQLVCPKEIACGQHLLSDKHLKNLSSKQVVCLDYPNLTSWQLKTLFLSPSFSEDEKKARVSRFIHPMYINNVYRTYPEIAPYIPSKFYRHLDVKAFTPADIDRFFPSVSPQHIHTECNYRHIENSRDALHESDETSSGGSSMLTFSKEELEEEIKNRKARCSISANNFTPAQLRTMKPMIAQEIQNLYPDFFN